MKKILLLAVFFLPSTLFACSLDRMTALQGYATDAQQNNHFDVALRYYTKLAHCDPSRGDYRIELLRTYLALENIEKAFEQRRWLIDNDAPSGLIQLTDTWINRTIQAQISNNKNHPQTSQRTRIALGTTYSSNANEVTSQSSIPVEIDGIPLELELLERPTSSYIYSLQADRQWRTQQHDLYISGQAFHYNALKENELRIMAGGIQRHHCFTDKICKLNLHLHHQKRASNHQQQVQLGTAMRADNQALGAYFRYSTSNTEASIHTLGIDWRYYTTHLQLHSAVEQERAQGFRPGADRLRMLISATGSIPKLPGFTGTITHQREFDQQAYAPFFWGEQKRDRQSTRVRAEYLHLLPNNWMIQADLIWQDTHSDITLFSHRGWSTGIKLFKNF